MERIWDIQGFDGGEADDYMKWPENSFYSAENIEVRKDLNGAKLSAEPLDTGWVISGNITMIKNLEQFGSSGILVCTDSGNVYKNGILMHTFARATATYNATIGIGSMFIAGTRYLYFISRTASGGGEIHKSNIDLNSWSDGFLTYSVGYDSSANSICTALENTADWGFFFTKNNKIIRVVGSTETIAYPLSFPSATEIVGFTTFQNNFKIYANFGNNGNQYYWSGTGAVDYWQVWENEPILSVANSGAYDYAIIGQTENYAKLVLVSGTQKQDLRVNLESSDYSRIFTGNLTVRKGIIYISGGKTGESTNFGIYTYGSYYPGSKKSLVQSFSSITRFLSHTHTSSASYFANQNGKVYLVSHNNPPSDANKTGFLTTLLYEGNSWEEKAIKRIKIGFKLELASLFRLYIRKDLGEAWQLAKTVDYATYGSKKWVTIPVSELKLNIGNFTNLQYKIELVSWYSSYPSSTPMIKRITTFMEVTNDK